MEHIGLRTCGTQRIENLWHTEDGEVVEHRGLRTGGAQRIENLWNTED